ncbi:hypothetical protein ACJ4V0_15930 [Phreatobacter sp. HK31-P]
MTDPIRPAGLKTSDLRKAIPAAVKVQVLLNQGGRCAATGAPLTEASKVRFDHRPPLQDRPWSNEAQDFVPPQNDPKHIQAIATEAHDVRTFGLGGTSRITTRGSDIGEAAHVRHLTTSQAEFRARILAKGEPAAEPQRQKFKRKIPSRPFPGRGQRSFSSKRGTA